MYGRRENFGEKRDSVVRVEMSRLRKRLVSYYADDRPILCDGAFAPGIGLEFSPDEISASPVLRHAAAGGSS